jgi:hypothetical protein
MHIHANLAEQLHINEQNLRQRKVFLRLSQHESELLRKYAGWAEQIAPAYAREFYDFQFDFPETRAFFERYAHKKGVSLAQLRVGLEQRTGGITYWTFSMRRSAAATSDSDVFRQSVYESAMCIM